MSKLAELSTLQLSTDKKIAGVAAGVAKWLSVDPVITRLGFIGLTLLTFEEFGPLIGVGLYLALWFVLPAADTNTVALTSNVVVKTVAERNAEKAAKKAEKLRKAADKAAVDAEKAAAIVAVEAKNATVVEVVEVTDNRDDEVEFSK